MFLNKKKKLLDLMDTIYEMTEILSNVNMQQEYISQCLVACNTIKENMDINCSITINIIDKIIDNYKQLQLNIELDSEVVNKILKRIMLLKNNFEQEVYVKLNIVFFPYKASMWDSMESIYIEASKDRDCVVSVVPIPYYTFIKDKKHINYEGDRFPSQIPITNFAEYDLEVEQPDIIYVHNIYDEYNIITQVHEVYFTSNLKKYTEMLVYVPYHISSFFSMDKSQIRCAYDLPGIKNVDKVIFVGEYIKEEAIRDGIPKEKILVLGSPKFDAVRKALENTNYPEEWKDKIEGKRVYMINTGCMTFVVSPLWSIMCLTEMLNIPLIDKDSIVLWRPHPLTEQSLLKQSPFLYTEYIKIKKKLRKYAMYNSIIIDETDDYLQAIKVADVLVSTSSSILDAYLITEKKVMFWDSHRREGNLLPPNVFYYTHNDDEPWYELVTKFAKGYDPLKVNRKEIASTIYTNVDGTCGRRVHKAIKECLI